MVINSTTETFSEDLKKANVSIVDFWAPWCGPCKVISPILEKFDSKNGDSINVIKINVDEQPELAEQFKIRNIPTLLFVKDGEIITQHVGTLSENDLTTKVNDLT